MGDDEGEMEFVWSEQAGISQPANASHQSSSLRAAAGGVAIQSSACGYWIASLRSQ
jgi:hypothetical protein